jgi:hypothetical protein
LRRCERSAYDSECKCGDDDLRAHEWLLHIRMRVA